MSRAFTVLAGVFLISLLQLAASSAEARPLRCGQCGTILDVDAIFYDHDVASPEPAIGTIIGEPLGSREAREARESGARGKGGLVGRNADRWNRRGGTIARRLELRMDRGGHRVVEVHGNFRVYRGDRVRLLSDRVVLLD